MKYTLLFSESAADFARRENPAEAPAYWAAWGAYMQAVNESGKLVSGFGLLPPATATTVRTKQGKREVHDGPYAESKEMLGGFLVIEAEHLDEALEWAARAPSSSYGSTEVRPVMPDME